MKDCRMKRPLVERLAVERLPDEGLAVKNCQMVPVHGPAGEQIPLLRQVPASKNRRAAC